MTTMRWDARAPVIIGVGQVVQRKVAEKDALSPIGLMAGAARRAEADAGAKGLLAKADCIAVVRSTLDSERTRKLPVDQWPNPPGSLARALAIPAGRRIITGPGGETPQKYVNVMAEHLAKGEHKLVLVAGAEAFRTQIKALQEGRKIGWGDEEPGTPETFDDPREGTNAIEAAHGLFRPVNAYPLFENALRVKYGRSVREHMNKLGELFAPFTRVAAGNPYAWFPKARSAEEIATEGPDNRFVGFPYTKYMNAIMEVDQGAAFILTTAGLAKELGVDPAKWVYLHGCAEAADIWNVTERVNFHSSPAMRLNWDYASAMAGVTLKDIAFFDLYSCFPSAVEIGCDEIGLAQDDPRGLTVTGGLPYAGGPGNNFVTHSIAAMAERLRAAPGKYGLVTANGYYLTKHAAGVYSTKAPSKPFERGDYKAPQREIDALPHPLLDPKPSGRGTIETFTVPHTRDKAMPAIVIGRLATGKRFIANSLPDEAVLRAFMDGDPIGRSGKVTAGEKTNLFVLD